MTFRAGQQVPKEKLGELIEFAQSLKDVFAAVPVAEVEPSA